MFNELEYYTFQIVGLGLTYNNQMKDMKKIPKHIISSIERRTPATTIECCFKFEVGNKVNYTGHIFVIGDMTVKCVILEKESCGDIPMYLVTSSVLQYGEMIVNTHENKLDISPESQDLDDLSTDLTSSPPLLQLVRTVDSETPQIRPNTSNENALLFFQQCIEYNAYNATVVIHR